MKVSSVSNTCKLIANNDLIIFDLVMMMMVLCPKAGSLAFMPPRDGMSEVVSHCLPHRQLWVSNLSKVATQWLEVDSNPHPLVARYSYMTTSHGMTSW